MAVTFYREVIPFKAKTSLDKKCRKYQLVYLPHPTNMAAYVEGMSGNVWYTTSVEKIGIKKAFVEMTVYRMDGRFFILEDEYIAEKEKQRLTR